jgi:dynein heavy chain
MVYDIKNQAWIDPELSHETPRWNHVGIMVHAIPSSKYFIFGGSVGNFEEGGNRTVSSMSDASYVLDMKSMQWSPI